MGSQYGQFCPVAVASEILGWARASPSWLLLGTLAEVSRQGSINQRRAA
jgi:hypothetical protein